MLEHVLKKYRTRLLDSWGKAKELRYSFLRDFITAREDGKYICLGGARWLDSLQLGINDILHPCGEIYGTAAGLDPAFARTCDEAVETGG